MENVTDRTSNPFGMTPPCERAVPGYGDANADFHLVGDHPGVHGGVDTGIPFTGTPAAERLQAALAEVGLLRSTGDEPEVGDFFASYLHMCVPEDEEPSEADYVELERYFDAELRAITAHVLLPVGERATEHVLREYTAQLHKHELDMARLHGTEILGAGWLVVPVRDPNEWESGDSERLVAALAEILDRDYHRESDLGRFLAGEETYRVR
ncbi:uracil-DNA glycosylase family protein [Halospeciosus flavus]|uniref:Uracil-DNA glycosylase family protein n=1 Tax=Halospeciosus flavus TaxID=3032283 RepID=A0ABD5Z4W5_9EURY|nr:uracil-DNA glycosylase family protein [Halospeciosus flavus]